MYLELGMYTGTLSEKEGQLPCKDEARRGDPPDDHRETVDNLTQE
jgi:hypothetical protein